MSRVERKMGNCYQSALEMILQNHHLILVHGVVTFDGGEMYGTQMVHAWCEDSSGTVYDYSNNRELIIPKDIYYKKGKIVDTVRYEYSEALSNLLDSENEDGSFLCGIWEERYIEIDKQSLMVAKERGVIYSDIDEHEYLRERHE